MHRVLNPELDRKILDTLAEKYHLMDKREGIHLSSLIGCLTKGWLDQKAPVELTDTEKLLFATGYGLQDVMTPRDAETPLLEKDGITYRPDLEFTLELGGVKELVEMKSTRAGVKKYQEGDLPESWIIYMKAGCHIRGTDKYNLSIIYIAQRPSADIISETLYFEPEELEENWQYILGRRDTYKEALDTDTLPPPRSACQDWECMYCRYALQCDAIAMMELRKQTESVTDEAIAIQEQAEKDIKELWPE